MVKSLAQEEFEVKHANEVEVAKRELMRRSHDIIRVYNPLETTFSFMYDRFWHRVPAKSYKDMERYLAMKFYKNICDKIIGDQIGKTGAELKAIREKQMGHQFMTAYEENVEVWDRTPKMDDPQLLAEVFKMVIKGVVEEFGMQQFEMNDPIPEAQADYRPSYEKMFDTLTPLSGETALPASLEEMKGLAPVEEPLAPSEKPVERIMEVDKKELADEVLVPEVELPEVTK